MPGTGCAEGSQVKKPGLTIDEHRELGQRFRRVKQELSEMGCLLSSSYAHPLSDKWFRRLDKLIDLRHDIEVEGHRQHGDQWPYEYLYRGRPDAVVDHREQLLVELQRWLDQQKKPDSTSGADGLGF